MNIKFCEKCEKEITRGEKFYEISVWSGRIPTEGDYFETDTKEMEGDYCQDCYKKIMKQQ